MVQELIDPTTKHWNFQALEKLFGFSIALSIATPESLTPIPPPATDCLIFTFAENGKFSIKKAYQLLRGDNLQVGDKEFWEKLWKGTKILPKLRLFVWRAYWNAIPVQAVLSARIRHLPSTCKICNQANETVMHALFQCHFARAVWLTSDLGLRTDQLTGNFKETISFAIANLDENAFGEFIAVTWAIWRSRNDFVYGNKVPNFETCKQYARKTREEITLLAQCTSSPELTPMALVQQQQGVQDDGEGFMCFVDGSWDDKGNAGIGAWLVNNGELVEWRSRNVQAFNSAQAEAKAIVEGYEMLLQHTNGTGFVLSDSKEAVFSLSQGYPCIQNWRSYTEIWKAWIMQKEKGGAMRCVYSSRDNQNMSLPHFLANQARLYGGQRIGKSANVQIQEID